MPATDSLIVDLLNAWSAWTRQQDDAALDFKDRAGSAEGHYLSPAGSVFAEDFEPRAAVVPSSPPCRRPHPRKAIVENIRRRGPDQHIGVGCGECGLRCALRRESGVDGGRKRKGKPFSASPGSSSEMTGRRIVIAPTVGQFVIAARVSGCPSWLT